jgi:predicted GTPase
MAHGNDKNRARVLILGAAGRDYHTFNTTYRTDPHAEVVGFTHAQASFLLSNII